MSFFDSVYESKCIPLQNIGRPFDMGEEAPNTRAAIKLGAKLFSADRLIPLETTLSPCWFVVQMKKLDLRKEFKYLYAPSARKVEIVDVPTFNFAMIDGETRPDETPATSQEYQNAIGALYGVSFTLKFMSKLRKKNPVDYPVMALEGLWWTRSGEFSFSRKEPWKWTMMIMQPQHITGEIFQDGLEQVRKKKENPSLSKIRLESFHEGLAVQTMHIGPYSEETRTITKMYDFARENGYDLSGKHHEIYLGDPRRAKPEKLRTILRHPISKSK